MEGVYRLGLVWSDAGWEGVGLVRGGQQDEEWNHIRPTIDQLPATLRNNSSYKAVVTDMAVEVWRPITGPLPTTTKTNKTPPLFCDTLYTWRDK